MSKQYGAVLPRRHFLRGAGGFSLALPILPSLAPREARGAQVPGAQLHFVSMSTEHGGITPANMYPLSSATQQTGMLTGHTIQHGPLISTVAGGKRSLSPVLTGDASVFTQRIADRMNVLRGLDIPFYISHHSGGHLGNYAERSKEFEQTPTIDQLMAWSPSFYGNGDPFKQRAILAGNESNFSFNYTNPANRSGGIQTIAPERSSKRIFDTLFAGFTPGQPAPARRALIVDRVIDNYRRLRNGNRRISSGDRQRLDDHMTRLLELERSVNVAPVATASCQDITSPTEDSGALSGSSPATSVRYYQLLNDVVVAAFMCGLSRIAATRITATFSDFSGSWHQDVAHQHTDPAKQQILATALQIMFEKVYLDLAKKLDVDAGTGRSLLDDTLFVWTQESGRNTHDSDSIPVIATGGAAGYFNTGLYVDFRNRTPAGNMHKSDHSLQVDGYTGLLYNRYLATALRAMRIPESEWKRPGVYGYGIYPAIASQFVWNDKPLYVAGAVESSDQALPVITA